MRARSLAPAAVAAILLTGCGVGPVVQVVADVAPREGARPVQHLPAPEQLAADTLAAVGQARSAHLGGTTVLKGNPFDVDVRIQGSDIAASVTTWDRGFEVVVVGGVSYARAAADFWANSGMPAEAATELAWVWLAVPDATGGEMLPVTWRGIAEELRGLLFDTTGATVGAGSLAGQPVYILTMTTGATVHIAASGPAYPLRIVDDAGARVDLSDFDEPQGIAAPPNPVDLDQYFGG